MQSIQELFEAAKTGNRAAFDELMEYVRPKVTSFCQRRMVSDLLKIVEVNDVLQETYLRAFQAIGKIEWQGERALCSWFCGISQNVIYTYSKQLLRIRPYGTDQESVDPEGTSPSRHARRVERFHRLEKALGSLTDEQQQIIRLTRIQGMSVRDAAIEMDRNEKATYQLLWRAIKKLREIFGETASLRLPANGNLERENHDA